MKTTSFDVTFPASYEKGVNKINRVIYKYVIKVPTLPAYAVEYATLTFSYGTVIWNNEVFLDENLTGIETYHDINSEKGILTIHYHGIRDYSLLFPSVSQIALRERLGQFYQEAEIAFDEGAWLSFSLMCGAIFEGLLYSKLGNADKFEKLINSAFSQNIINANTKDIMHKVRNHRNLVHANRSSTSYVSRTDAMDTRTVLDLLIKAA